MANNLHCVPCGNKHNKLFSSCSLYTNSEKKSQDKSCGSSVSCAFAQQLSRSYPWTNYLNENTLVSCIMILMIILISNNYVTNIPCTKVNEEKTNKAKKD